MLNLKTSARNHFTGTVSAYKQGAVNDEVEIKVGGGTRVVAVVTHESAQTLGLKVGATAHALIKASSVVLATDLEGVRLSARNQFEGKVTAFTPGAVNAEVVVDVGGGLSIAAVVTKTSAQALGLAVGKQVTALFKASSVIVATAA
jgi:molybdate transport system regulatory protein